ncbi:hypothetical protein NK8_04460 [Caballeronia sp. NK8]|nr:hypothetical protein NK8_04460 [Caballeronia sp. NK8]
MLSRSEGALLIYHPFASDFDAPANAPLSSADDWLYGNLRGPTRVVLQSQHARADRDTQAPKSFGSNGLKGGRGRKPTGESILPRLAVNAMADPNERARGDELR